MNEWVVLLPRERWQMGARSQDKGQCLEESQDEGRCLEDVDDVAEMQQVVAVVEVRLPFDQSA